MGNLIAASGYSNGKAYVRVFFLVLLQFFLYQGFAQMNVVLVRVIGKAKCGYNTDLCYSLERGSEKLDDLTALARKRVPCNSAILLNDVGAGVKNFVVVESSFIYPDTDCKGLVYSLGTGNTREEAMQDAVKKLKGNNYSWRSSFPVRVVREEAVTPGGGYDKSITSYGSAGTKVNTSSYASSKNSTPKNTTTPKNSTATPASKPSKKNPLGDPPTVRHNTSLPYEGFDPYTKELFHKLQLAVDARKADDIYSLVKELKEVYLQGYPDLAGQLSNDLDVLLSEFDRQMNAEYGSYSALPEPAPTPTPSPKNTTKSSSQNAKGWQIIREYQQLLNAFIDACNSRNEDGMTRVAQSLQEWAMTHENDFQAFTKEQSDAIEKCMDYFTDMILNGSASNGTRHNHVDFIGADRR